METTQLSVPVTASQTVTLARQLLHEDKKRLLDVLNQDVEAEEVGTHWTSKQVLSKDWLSETEEQVWQHL